MIRLLIIFWGLQSVCYSQTLEIEKALDKLEELFPINEMVPAQSRIDFMALQHLLSGNEDVEKTYDAIMSSSRNVMVSWISSEDYQRIKEMGQEESLKTYPLLKEQLPVEWQKDVDKSKSSYEILYRLARVLKIEKLPYDKEYLLKDLKEQNNISRADLDLLKSLLRENLMTSDKVLNTLSETPYKWRFSGLNKFPISHLSLLRETAKTYSYSAKMSLRLGNTDSALSYLRKLTDLTEILKNAEGSATDFLVTLAVIGIHNEAHVWAAAHNKADISLLKELYKNVNRISLAREFIFNSFKSELDSMIRNISQFCTDKPHILIKQYWAVYGDLNSFSKEEFIELIKKGNLINKNKMTSSLSLIMQTAITLSEDQSFETFMKVREKVLHLEKDENTTEKNFHKKIFYSLLPVFAASCERYQERRVRLAAAKLCIALRTYELREGTLPDSLDALVVRGILKKLPVDSWNGKGFLYDKNKREIKQKFRRYNTLYVF